MWLYILIFLAIAYALVKEMQALGCSSASVTGKDCDNANGKAVKGSGSYTTDSSQQILDNIDYAVDYNSRFVKWRSFFITSFVGVIMLWFVVFQKFPSEWELVVGIIILFLMLMLVNGFYHFHLYRYVQINVNESTDILRARNIRGDCGPIEERYKTFTPYHNMNLESGMKYSPFLV